MAPNDPIVFECPQCLGNVSASSESAGQRIPCPDCEASLLVPGALASGGGFDDLFDDPVGDPTQPPDDANEEGLQVAPEEVDLEEVAPEADAEDTDRETGSIELADGDELLVGDDQQSGEWDPSSTKVTPPGEVKGEQASDEFDLQLEPLEEDVTADQGDDPFVVDNDAPIKIDGLKMDGNSDQIFGLKCPVCDTRIHVNLNQVGSTVECPICFSSVQVSQPFNKPKPKTPWSAPVQEPEAEDELKLEDPDERSDTDYGIKPGYGLEPIEQDLLKPTSIADDEIVDLEIIDDLAQDPEEDDSEMQPHALDDEDELRLQDLSLEPESAPTHDGPPNGPPPLKRSRAIRRDQSAPAPDPSVRWREEPEADPGSDHQEPDAGPSGSSASSMLSGLKQLVEWMKTVFQSPQLSVRALISVGMFAIGYSFFDSFDAAWGDEAAGEERSILGLITTGFLGCLFWLPSAVLFSITFSVLFRDSAEGDAKVDQWPELGFSEWFGSFAFTAVSFWAGALPGFFLGNLLYFMTGSMIGLLILVPISVFLIMPICLVSALFNESIVNIFAPDIMKTISREQSRWIKLYQTVLVLLGIFLLGTFILYLPSILFSLLGALVQVVAALALAAAVGLHARQVIDEIQ